jgi:uncharacterized membrane protein YhiD involved in acid resistance
MILPDLHEVLALLFAMLLGGAIGFEREINGKPCPVLV